MDLKPALKYIIKNPIRKIFAIIFAFGLWIFVAIDNTYQYDKVIKVIYTNLSESFIIVDSISTIDVKFTGRGGTLFSIWAVPPKAQCDLSKGKLGKNQISVKDLIVPTGFGQVLVSYPYTKSINVALDEKITKKIQVTVPTKGTAKEGYSISDVAVLDTVNVTGPEGIIRDLRELMTESLSIKNRTSSFEKKLKILNPSPFLSISHKHVSVKVDFETTIEHLFINIPLKLIYSPNQQVSSEKISLDTLIVKGAKSAIARLQKRDIEVRIKLTKLTPGDYDLTAGIILPDYIKMVYSKPKKFKVKIY
jgi:YbbR domain-containing protein